MFKTFIASILLLGTFNHAQAELQLVTTIKPLQLIALAISKDSDSVVALFPANQSPHHYSLTVSDRFSLQQADLLIWAGEELETFLAPSIRKLASRTQIIEALRLPELQRLQLPDEHLDPHFWLSPGNALVLAEAVKQQLISLDTDNAELYQHNYQQFALEIAAMDESLQEAVRELSQRRFLVYHNAYQYMENYYGFAHQIALLADTEVAPGIQQILATRTRVAELQAECLFLEIDANQATIDTLLSRQTIKTVTPDLMGHGIEADASGYIRFIEKIIYDMQSCFH